MDKQTSGTKETVPVLFTELRDPITQELYGVIGVYDLETEKQARFVKRDPETNKIVFCDPPEIFVQNHELLSELQEKLAEMNIVLQTSSARLITTPTKQDKPQHLN